MLRISILIRDRNESHLKISRNIAKMMGAKVCTNERSSDIVIGMDSTSAYLPCLAKAKLGGAITAAFIHDIRSISHTYLTAKDAGRSPFEQRLRRTISLNFTKPFIDVFFSPTNAAASTIKEYTGIDPCVVPLGVDHTIYKPAGARKRSEQKIILTIATKPHIVKASIAIFRRLRTKSKLLVRGPRVAKAPGVYYLPKLTEHALARLYSMADVLLYPTLHEGFGLVVLEAMACGTPVIAFEEPAVREVAGDAAIFVKLTSLREVAETVDWVLNNDDLLKEMSEKGLNRAREFTWEKTVRALYACLMRKLVHF
jgi:glycosyltransferase involved in cell wall biosynthesis